MPCALSECVTRGLVCKMSSDVITLPYAGYCMVDVRAGGKVRLPDFVRRVLDRSPSRIFIGLHETEPCLSGYDMRWQEQMRSAFDRRRLHEDQGEGHACFGLMRRVFGSVEEAGWPCDTIRLPELARHIVGIEDRALFVGTGGAFEIWNPERAAASGDPALAAITGLLNDIDRPGRRRA